MREPMLKLRDCELLNFDTGLYCYSGGCPTCEYGSQYVNKITVETTNHTINIEINNMYEHMLSQSDCIKLLTCNLEKIQNMTEKEFIEFLKEFFEEKKKEADYGNQPYCLFEVEEKQEE
jgi:hypothetical protein